MYYRVITLTGLDRTGKATQARLLAQALSPAKLKSFPDYSHWSGELIRAVLSEEQFVIDKFAGTECQPVHFQEKEPYLFQALQFANGRAHYAELEAARREHHWVLDRGPACAHAFGRVDGCDPEFLRVLGQYQVMEDLVLVMLGGPYPRAGEVPDLNERDTPFQARVKAEYRGLVRNRQGWLEVPLDLVPPGMGKEEAITFIHHTICMLVTQEFPNELLLTPLTQAQVRTSLRTGQPALSKDSNGW